MLVFLLQLPQQNLNIDLMEPVLFWGPIRAQTVVKRPRAKRSENPRVASTNTPNCMKKRILAPSMKREAPTVVQAPDNTEMPTSVSASL